MFVPVEGELEEGAEGEVEEVEVGLGGSHGVTGRVRTEAEREREALALARVRRQNPLVPVGARIKYKGNRHKPRERERPLLGVEVVQRRAPLVLPHQAPMHSSLALPLPKRPHKEELKKKKKGDRRERESHACSVARSPCAKRCASSRGSVSIPSVKLSCASLSKRTRRKRKRS